MTAVQTPGATPGDAHRRDIVATFEVRMTRFLDPAGTPTQPLPAFAEDRNLMVRLYRAMVLTRTLDAKAVALQRTGRLGTYASSLGQEAVTVGVAASMRDDDVLLPSFREQGAQLWRGVTPVEVLQYWGGDERGSNFAGPRRDFPVCIPVGTQTTHAAGVALAMKLRREPRVAVCVLGDGATSKGDFAEGLNCAGAWSLPLVYVVNNNQWAISVPRTRQSAAETLAQKAIAAGVPGEQVDGNDVIAVHEAVARVVERARGGGGPGVVEAVTYRLADHTTADDASRYRSDDEVSRAWAVEPIARLRAYLGAQHGWAREDETALVAACQAEIDAVAEAYLALIPEPPEAMFDHLFATLPRELARQRDEAVALARDASALADDAARRAEGASPRTPGDDEEAGDA